MKRLIAIAAVFTFASTGFSKVIVECNTPEASTQEFKLLQSADQYSVDELRSGGSWDRNIVVKIDKKGCYAWVSPSDGSIQLCVEKTGARKGWFYSAHRPGISIQGYADCF